MEYTGEMKGPQIHEDAPFSDSTYVRPRCSVWSRLIQGGESSHQCGRILCGTVTKSTGNQVENIINLHGGVFLFGTLTTIRDNVANKMQT